jgi:cyclic beta-1,2-glucan synthetase
VTAAPGISTTQTAPEPPAATDADARALAETHRALQRTQGGHLKLLHRRSTIARALERTRRRLAATLSPQAMLPRAVEWFLDNYYLIRRVARQVDDELPRGFVRHLPQLASGPSEGQLRVGALAQAMVMRSSMELEAAPLHRFLEAYQSVSPLTIAELWALPTMLRAAVLEQLMPLLQGLNADGVVQPLALDPAARVERSVRGLRVLDAIDWKTFFERANRVDAILRADPARVYARMNFGTCDSYRKVVEALAWGTGTTEEEVADLAIVLARERKSDEPAGHVGYYLIGAGRRALEERLGYHPVGLERVRRLVTRRPTLSYLLPLGLLTVAPLLWGGSLLARAGAGAFTVAVATGVAVIPVSVVALAVLQAALARLLPPRTLPGLDFTRGLPEGTRTLVVIPTLLGRAEDVTGTVRQIELHYLSNPDPRLQFALLTDDVDSPTRRADTTLLESAARAIDALNARHGKSGRGPFHLLHRESLWNPSEERFIGWERKRGKLEELNRLLRGDKKTSFTRHVGDPEGLLGIRFVITLDGDTQLPMEGAHRLVGLLAHPLNRAVFDEHTGRVTSGYTIAQPRVETSPSSSRRTWFSRFFAGDIGFDIYTRAVSETYQDLFGSGIYCGKGIYDVDAFVRSIDGRVPENTLVSHDLFEGIQGRAALVTDIVLFEDYPSSYAAFAQRMHRWVRGDWQLLPWLMPKVPTARGERVPNTLAPIDRWKIVDNLRRSLNAPFLVLLFVLGWAWLPGGALLWTLLALGLLLGPLLPSVIFDRRLRVENLGRCALAVAFLAYEAVIEVDAMVRVFVRTRITRKRLLQWTTAAHAARGIASKSPQVLYWHTMLASPLLAVAVALTVAWARSPALLAAAPLLLVWCAAPEIAYRVSRPLQSRAKHLGPLDRKKLRELARRTWRFFDAFVGPNDQWLPVDNYQEEPREQTAHRTSPTNIGLMLLATLSAYDFGFIGLTELSLRVRLAFDSVGRLARYQGHLFNWYETKSLQPLLPHYVSTVDSGNYAGCLVALKQGCLELASAPIVRREAWEGLRDSVDLLAEVVEAVPRVPATPLLSVFGRMQRTLEHGRDHPDDAYPTLRLLCDGISPELDRDLLGLLEAGAFRQETDVLRALRTSIDRLRNQLQQMRRELETLLPWLALVDEIAAEGIVLPKTLQLDEIPQASRRLRSELDARQRERAAGEGDSPEMAASAQRLTEAFELAEANASHLKTELLTLAARAEEDAWGMDFRLLFDGERKLFYICYNATVDQADQHHYDLLASEARLASYLAIVDHAVQESHWYALGRPMTQLAGGPALLSWGGTMFEYLMPELLMRSREGTLLAQTSDHVVDAQIAYARRRSEPWGVSESAYARLDAGQTYQYRSFGVPGLGFKRGLEDDRVVTPYASVLALGVRPRAVVENLAALDSMGMLGTYGMFEALDFAPERALPDGGPVTVVRSYMAHHQGMLLVALGNFLNQRSMVDRFHADARVQTGEVLLNEHAPDAAPPEWPIVADAEGPDAGGASHVPTQHAPEWTPAETAYPQALALSNGRLTTLLTDSGGGGLSWKGIALTRYDPDSTRDDEGIWIYLRDRESGHVWRATSAQGRTTYAMHRAQLHRRGEGISVHVDVAVAPVDDVEVRQITLHNETDRPRRLSVSSAGRPVLIDARQAPSHPAFSSMFVESEALPELEAILFHRRPQSPDEEAPVLVHRLVREGAAVTFAGYETDRGAFFGRCSTWEAPESLVAGRESRRGRVGAVLDPVMSLTASVVLKPRGSVTLAFVTAVGRSGSAASDLARRYGSMHTVRWMFGDAERETSRRLQRTKLEPALLPAVQRLLSALLFADPAMRAPVEDAVAVRPSKRRLWGHGISGDDPILLLRVHDPEAPVLVEALSAQRFLRSCGVRLDMVLLDEQPSGYAGEGSGALRRVLSRNDAGDWLNRHGGVFVIAVDQVSGDERRHLEASARVVLDTRGASLGALLGRAARGRAKLPAFEPTLVRSANHGPRPRPRPEGLLFDNGTGGFSADGGEYVLSVPVGKTTPAPWCNVLANADFGCLVTESSLGSTWSINSGENRITPWRNDPVFDTPAEVLYLRDEETAAVWTPTPLPAGREAETLVRHGAGYTRYERESEGLEQEMTVFVPADAPLKIVRLRLRNTLARRRRVTATYYAEWVLGTRREEQRPYIASEIDRAHDCLLATCNWNVEFGGRVAFLAARQKAHGFTTDRSEFLGRRGDYASPAALERWGLSGSVDPGVDPCAALQVHIELAPGEERETHFILGQAASRDEAVLLVTRFREVAEVESAWNGLHAFWDGLLGNVRVQTPEPAMDLMLNRWLLYQSLSSRVFGRTAFYQSSGAFGFRDQLQDVMALLHAWPERARAHILEAAAHQFEAGDVLHWWHPPAGRGVRTRCSDDMLWLPFVTAEYVVATGDTSILAEPVRFLTGDPLRADEHDRYAQYDVSTSAAPLLEHCRKALERGATEGAHGLPRMGDGDWNDGMNRIGSEGRGESVWLAWFLCETMDRFAALSARMMDGTEETRWRRQAQSLRAKIAASAWDGGWYLRAFHDDGSLVGSAGSRECRIDSIAQSWSVLARGEDATPASDERATLAVGAAHDQLVREADRLVLLFWPPFDSTLHDPGYVRAYPPGIRENGGQYTHAATWLGWADAERGDGKNAERVFRLLNPILRSSRPDDVQRYRVEPYVLAGDIYSVAPWVGRGGWTWYTGAAAWMWRLGVEAILGLHLDEGGLRVDPCIPPAWNGFEAWVSLGKRRIHVRVENPDHVARGVTTVTLDGAPLDTPRIQLDPGTEGGHEMLVRLGPVLGALSAAPLHGDRGPGEPG